MDMPTLCTKTATSTPLQQLACRPKDSSLSPEQHEKEHNLPTSDRPSSTPNSVTLALLPQIPRPAQPLTTSQHPIPKRKDSATVDLVPSENKITSSTFLVLTPEYRRPALTPLCCFATPGGAAAVGNFLGWKLVWLTPAEGVKFVAREEGA
ncbi:hypothetical protein B0A50_07392 [Salinomyces thailandicus]|uniref:Uncharacterized protein n=1 Tax=Salinomyces thailandicus TaxID=706561 RepID=A0A4U0TMW6_9PEZI|nr:hypothetical protein B0A50_07392 [Salinomyces thailandica]